MAGFSRVSLLKVLEVILACVCLGLHYHSYEASDLHTLLLCSATFGGFLVILAGLFAGLLSGQPMPKRVDIFYSIAGVALFAASGVLAIQYAQDSVWNIVDKDRKNMGIAKGSLSIVNAVVFLLDVVFTFRD